MLYMAWRDLREYILNLRDSDELIRISHPVDCYLEAGCIADKLVNAARETT